MSIIHGCAVAVGTDPNDHAAGLKALADIVILTNQVKADVRRLKNINHDLYLRSLTRLEQAFINSNSNAPLSTLLGNVDGVILQGLEFCADQLDRVSTETVVSPQMLTQLLKDLEAVTKTILASDLDAGFQALLIAKLEEIRSAILAYRLFGLTPLQNAVESAVGALIIRHEQAKEPKNRKAAKDWLAFVVSVQTIIKNFVVLGRELPPVVMKLLGSGN